MVTLLNLKEYSKAGFERITPEEKKDEFKTIHFDPNELIMLKSMDHKELIGLMLFCGIRVYNGIPLVVMEEDEMRMAYVIWRSSKMNEEKERNGRYIERGIKWFNLIQKAIDLTLKSK